MTPKIHHPNSDMQRLFDEYCVYVSKWKELGKDRDLPSMHCLKNGNYAIWSDACTCDQSAWNQHCIIEGSGWSNPFETKPEDKENCLYIRDILWDNHNQKNLKKNPKKRLLKGSYVGFHSWQSNNYGHILHDNHPLLAYLNATLNESYKFIMLNRPVIKEIIKALDNNFYDRIEWIENGEIVTVDGNLIVPKPDHYPCIMAKNLMSFFLEWSSRSLPKPVERNKIIFYTRRNTTNFRVLNAENEKEIVHSLKKFLADNKVDGELVVFSGKDENGNTLPIDEQISIFRSAHTIIGPHGTGLVNVMWCYFDDEPPVKLLEFCPGPVGYSSQVQHEFNGYHNVLRGLPLDYHIVLYEQRSTPEETFVSLDDFNVAIAEMIPKGTP